MECAGLPDGVEPLTAKIGALLAQDAAFRIDAAAMAAKVPDVVAELLPDGMKIRIQGRSFRIDRGKKANPSGLTLRYNASTGAFTGSFRAYRTVNGRNRTVTVTVAGMVLDGKGYGTASVKKLGGVPIAIE